MMKKITTTIILGLSLAASSQAALVFYEGFGGLTPNTPVETQSTWFPANPNVTIDDYFYASATSLSNAAFAGTGLSNAVGSTYYDQGLGINAHNVIRKALGTSYNGDTGGTFYFSYLLDMTAASVLASNTARFSLEMDSATGRRIYLETVGSELRYRVAGAPGGGGGNPEMSVTTASTPFAGGGTFFIVGKVTLAAGAGNDQFYASIYTTGSVPGVEPAISAWTLETTAGAGSSLNNVNEFNQVSLISGIADGNSFDEIRVGTTWADVTAVPEPSTYALMSGFLALGLVMIRRRIKQ